MQSKIIGFAIGSSLILGGCAGLDFGKEGLTYNEPKPYLFVSVDKDCLSTATVVSVPGNEKHVKFKSGFGSADLSVTLSNGILTSVGQKTDTKIPETITAMAGLGGLFKTQSENKSKLSCNPTATLYPIVNGAPDLNQPSSFPVELAKPDTTVHE